MITISPKIHDQFSVEFKIGFIPDSTHKNNYFELNTWMFIPNSLNINATNYGKSQFYQDFNSNLRLITPVFKLNEIACAKSIPLINLEQACRNIINSSSEISYLEDYEFQIKMYIAIIRSAIRQVYSEIRYSKDDESLKQNIIFFIENISIITSKYRSWKKNIDNSQIDEEKKDYFSFGDEFLSYIIDLYTFRLIELIKDKRQKDNQIDHIYKQLIHLVQHERSHKLRNSYLSTNDKHLSNLVYRYGKLKKFVESDLYVRLKKSQDRNAIEQLLYSIAAGLAMVVAIVLSNIFQKTFANYSIALFIALVIAYILKDRTKEFMRYFFAYKLNNKYFDNKLIIKISNETIGWIKDGVDFISEAKVPKTIMALRSRTSLVKAENRMFQENILLYRKRLYINADKLKKYNKYHQEGINDIILFHLKSFTNKMNDPKIPINTINKQGKISLIKAHKVYYINFLMQIKYEDVCDYKRYVLVMDRNGIKQIKEVP